MKKNNYTYLCPPPVGSPERQLFIEERSRNEAFENTRRQREVDRLHLAAFIQENQHQSLRREIEKTQPAVFTGQAFRDLASLRLWQVVLIAIGIVWLCLKAKNVL